MILPAADETCGRAPGQELSERGPKSRGTGRRDLTPSRPVRNRHGIPAWLTGLCFRHRRFRGEAISNLLLIVDAAHCERWPVPPFGRKTTPSTQGLLMFESLEENIILFGLLGSIMAGLMTSVGALPVLFGRHPSNRAKDVLLRFAAGVSCSLHRSFRSSCRRWRHQRNFTARGHFRPRSPSRPS